MRHGWPRLPPRDGPLARVIDSGPDEDLEKIEFAVLQAVSCARTSIAVMTPVLPAGRAAGHRAVPGGDARRRGRCGHPAEEQPHRSWIGRPARISARCYWMVSVSGKARRRSITPSSWSSIRMVPDRKLQLGHPLLPAEFRALRGGLRPRPCDRADLDHARVPKPRN